MTSDFIFIEEVEGGDPIVDGITPTRLESEWKGVVIELKSPQIQITSKLWENLIEIYKSLQLQNPNKCIEMLQTFLQELSKMLYHVQYINQYGNITSLYYDLLKLYSMPLINLNKDYLLPFFKKLPELSILCPEDTIHFLDLSLEPYCCDDIIDDNDNSLPFIDFLIDGFTSFSPISEKIRALIEKMINDGQRDSFSYFLPKFVEKCIDVIQQIMSISPTIFIDNTIKNLLTWMTNIIYQTKSKGAITDFNSLFAEKVMKLFDTESDNIIFYSCFALFTSLNSYQCMYIFISKILEENSFFISKVHNEWVFTYPQELLELINVMISLRCSAIMNAFFFVPNMDKTYHLYGFPSIPVQYAPGNDKSINYDDMPSPESYRLFSNFNQELPTLSPHRVSLLDYIVNMFESFWKLSVKDEELLTEIIEKLVGSSTPHAYYFCFTQGKFIYAQVAKNLPNLDKCEPEKREVFCRFVRMMNILIAKYPQPNN